MTLDKHRRVFYLLTLDPPGRRPSAPIVDPHHHLWDSRAGEGGGHVSAGRPGVTVDPAARGWQLRYLLDQIGDRRADLERRRRDVEESLRELDDLERRCCADLARMADATP